MLLGSLRACSVHTFSIPLHEVPGSIPLSLCKGWCSESHTVSVLWSSSLPTLPYSPFAKSRQFCEKLNFPPPLLNPPHFPCQGSCAQSVPPRIPAQRQEEHTHDLPFASSIPQGSRWAGFLCHNKLLVEAVVCLVGTVGSEKHLSCFSQIIILLARRLLLPEILEFLNASGKNIQDSWVELKKKISKSSWVQPKFLQVRPGAALLPELWGEKNSALLKVLGDITWVHDDLSCDLAGALSPNLVRWPQDGIPD